MLHAPAVPVKRDGSSAWKAKLGIRMFWLYCAVYAGFVALAVFATETLKAKAFLGLNLAVAFGVGLIVFAIILGLIYNRLCARKEDAVARQEANS